MLIKVGIDQGQHQNLAVPEAAVQFEGSQASVFLITKGPKGQVARRAAVQTGITTDGFIEITSGLKPGDKIVGDGLNRVQDGAPVNGGGKPQGGPQGGRGDRKQKAG
jgi:membrane fusion protein (multidrug efflux system)